nr:MAG TPA: hypothetical protein [Caudoviricetes sp.]
MYLFLKPKPYLNNMDIQQLYSLFYFLLPSLYNYILYTYIYNIYISFHFYVLHILFLI